MTTITSVNWKEFDQLLASGTSNFQAVAAAMMLALAADKNIEAHSAIDTIESRRETINAAREHLYKLQNAPEEIIMVKYNEFYPEVEYRTGCHEVTESTLTFMKKNNILPSGLGSPQTHNKKQCYTRADVQKLTAALERFLESAGDDTQTHMVNVEDLMGKFNTYCNGASKVTADASQLWRTIMS